MNIKIIKIVALILIISSLSGCSVGCSNDAKEEVSSVSADGVEKTLPDDIDEAVQDSAVSDTVNTDVSDTDNTESGGGNPYQSDTVSVQITVSGNEYIYENKTVSFDEIGKIIDDFGDNYVVEVYDDSASEKAYKALIEKLKELNISYTEVTE